MIYGVICVISIARWHSPSGHNENINMCVMVHSMWSGYDKLPDTSILNTTLVMEANKFLCVCC